MKVVKYTVDLTEVIQVSLPRHAKPLRFKLQGNQLYLWALVDPEEPLRPFVFRCAGTGHELVTDELRAAGVYRKDQMIYINTVDLAGGLVVHFFEMKGNP